MPSNNTSVRSTALTGLALTATIAHEATDGVPIINQVLGAVSRILKLAEKIEKDREALHALADRSQKLSLRIKAVLGDRTTDGQILQSLESIRDVLHAIQSLFENLVAKTRIRRTVSYLFSVPRDVERLSAELEGALQEFLLIAALDTNVRVRETSRTIGHLRLLHDFEIEKLELVADVTSEDGSCMVKYHAARVEGAGRLFVVRYLQAATVEGPAGDAEKLQRQLDEHDGILENISSVEKSHPNIAYSYGRSAGCSYNRFIVLRTGFIPLADTVCSPGVSLGTIWSISGFMHKTVERSQVASFEPLKPQSQSHLQQLESAFVTANSRGAMWGWSQTLRRLVTRSADRVGSGVFVGYNAAPTADSWDNAIILRVADDGERIEHLYYRIRISPERRREVRQTLGIVVPDSRTRWSSFESVHLDDSAVSSPAGWQWVELQNA